MDSLDRHMLERDRQPSFRTALRSQATSSAAATPSQGEFETPREHPCHQHLMVRVDASRVYRHIQPAGHWHCDHCHRTGKVLQQRYPWHCAGKKKPSSSMTSSSSGKACDYDLCDECFLGAVHPLHQHRLRLADANQIYAREQGIWACEYCNLDRMTTKERYPYHCRECGTFDLCRRCYEGIRHPLHPHRLQPASADLVYFEHGGMWFCDMCHSSRKQLREGQMWHCVSCSFDLCVSCASGALHPAHTHKLFLADADVAYAGFKGLWSCDLCDASRRASGQRFMRHCAECSFDLCNNCFVAGLSKVPGGIDASQLSPTERQAVAGAAADSRDGKTHLPFISNQN